MGIAFLYDTFIFSHENSPWYLLPGHFFLLYPSILRNIYMTDEEKDARITSLRLLHYREEPQPLQFPLHPLHPQQPPFFALLRRDLPARITAAAIAVKTIISPIALPTYLQSYLTDIFLSSAFTETPLRKIIYSRPASAASAITVNTPKELSPVNSPPNW